MSDTEKRTPISIYLTPRASMILKQYSVGSGYGSVSRTVEEIILAFDSVYGNLRLSMKSLVSMAKEKKGQLTNAERTVIMTSIIALLTNLENVISRLNKETEMNP